MVNLYLTSKFSTAILKISCQLTKKNLDCYLQSCICLNFLSWSSMFARVWNVLFVLMRVCYNILLILLQVLLMCEHTHDSQMSNTSLERLSSGIVSFPSSCDGWRHGLSKSNEIQQTIKTDFMVTIQPHHELSTTQRLVLYQM